MKKHRLLSLFTSLVMFASLASCAVPETTSTSKSAPAPKAQATAETTTDETEKLVLEWDYKHTYDAVRIFWNEIEDVQSYEIQIRKGESQTSKKYCHSYSSDGYRIEKLQPGTAYTVKVIAKYGLFSKKDDIESNSIIVKTDSYGENKSSKNSNPAQKNIPNSDKQTYTTTKATTQYKSQTTTLAPCDDSAYRYYCSRNGTLYHDRNVGCDRGGTITDDNKRWSKTPPSGYKPCPVCFPNG